MKQQPCHACGKDLNDNEKLVELRNNPDPRKIYTALVCDECKTCNVGYDMNKISSQCIDRTTRHLRGYHHSGGVTLLYKHIIDNTYRVSWAICSPEDNYDRKKGVEICQNRWDTRYLMLDITPGLSVNADMIGFNYKVEDAIILSLFAVLINKRKTRKIEPTRLSNEAPLIHRSINASFKEDEVNDDFHEWKMRKLMKMVKWDYNQVI